MNERIPSKVNTIFFDLDNTLIPTRKGDSRACRKLSECLQLNHNFTEKEAEESTSQFLKTFRNCPDNIQVPLDTWRNHLWGQALPQHYKHLSQEIYKEWLQLRYFYLAIPTEYQNLLKSFRRAGYNLGLITNGPTTSQWEKVSKLNVSQFFDCILVSSDLPWEKPHPNIFYAACNYLNVKPEECVMIGDKIGSDIKGGNAANLSATFWVPLNAEKLRSYQEKSQTMDLLEKPSFIIENVLALYDYFPKCSQIVKNPDDIIGNDSAHHQSTSSFRRNSSQTVITSKTFRPHHKRVSSLPEIEYYSENSSDTL